MTNGRTFIRAYMRAFMSYDDEILSNEVDKIWVEVQGGYSKIFHYSYVCIDMTMVNSIQQTTKNQICQVLKRVD